MKNMWQFLHEVKVELSKVEWPTFPALMGAAIVVFVVVVIAMLFLGVVDKVISTLIKQIFLYNS